MPSTTTGLFLQHLPLPGTASVRPPRLIVIANFTMAKKSAAPSPAAKPVPSTPAKSPAPAPRQTPTPSTSRPSTKVAAKELSPRSSPQEIAVHVWNRYIQDTPSRTLFLDVFLLYIALNGAVQFVYCILGGNYVSLSSGDGPVTICESAIDSDLALQCLSLWLLRRRRPVRPDHLPPNADIRATTVRGKLLREEDDFEDHRRCHGGSGGSQREQHQQRKSLCRFRLWKPYSPWLLCQLHQLDQCRTLGRISVPTGMQKLRQL